jgi:hypothetical protein
MGAALGGGVGALGGPATAALGAGLGNATGEALKQGELDEEVAKIKALTEGDVEKLLELKMKEEGGFLEQMQTWFWSVLKWCILGSVLYFVVPMIYTRHIHKKIK